MQLLTKNIYKKNKTNTRPLMLLSKTRLIGIFKKKCTEELENKGQAKSRDNNKLQKPASAHWHIKYMPPLILPYNNKKINWRDVQTKNVDMSCLRAPWQNGPYKN